MQIYEASYHLEQSLFEVQLADLLRLALQHNGEHERLIQEKTKTTLLGENQSWVITQYLIDYYGDVDIDSPIKLTTSIIEANRFFISRRNQIFQSNQLILSFDTQFTVINLIERKISRLNLSEEFIAQCVNPSLSTNYPKFEYIEGRSETLQPIEIGEQHIDLNQHVNNLAYISWGVEHLPEALSSMLPVRIHIKYNKEVLPGESLAIDTQKNKNNVQQIIFNLSTDQKACMINYERLK